MRHQTHPAPWTLQQHCYANTVRAHEFAEKQVVSLLEIDGIGEASLRAMYKVGVDAADKILATPTEEVVEKLSPYNVPPGSLERKCERVEQWKEQIRRIKEGRDDSPMSEGASGRCS